MNGDEAVPHQMKLEMRTAKKGKNNQWCHAGSIDPFYLSKRFFANWRDRGWSFQQWNSPTGD